MGCRMRWLQANGRELRQNLAREWASDREEEWEGFDDSDGEEWPEETELAPRPGSRGSGACAAAAKFASRGRRKKNRGGGVT